MDFFWFSPPSLGAKYEFQHPSFQNFVIQMSSSGRIQAIRNRLEWTRGTGDDNMVEVPDTLCPFSDHILSQLRQSVHPNSDGGNYGISLYINAVSEVTRLLQFQN